MMLPAYRVEQWRTEQGLPQNTVQCLLQTRNGYLWAGTRFGLARYDGFKRFVIFQRANTPAMVSENCLGLAEDDEGSLWVGTDDGLLRWQDHAWTRYTTADGLGHNLIRSLSPRLVGGVWVGTERGLSWRLANRFVTLRPRATTTRPTSTGPARNAAIPRLMILRCSRMGAARRMMSSASTTTSASCAEELWGSTSRQPRGCPRRCQRERKKLVLLKAAQR